MQTMTPSISLADLSFITDKYRDDIDRMKQLFGFLSAGEQFTVKEGRVHIPNTKYQHDLFFIAPFYHREVTSLISKLIVIDIDLEFKLVINILLIIIYIHISTNADARIDLLELHSLFSEFRAGECVGIGPDLSPHYRNMAAAYRSSHPGTRVGQPGRFQVTFTHSVKTTFGLVKL